MIILKIIGAIFCSLMTLGGLIVIASPSENVGSVYTYVLITFLFGFLDYKLIKSIKAPKKKYLKEPNIPETSRINEEAKKFPLEQKIEFVENLTELPIVENACGIILKPGEFCHYQSSASVLIIKNQVIGRSGGYRGASIRIAKGLTLHTGGSRGQAIRQDISYTYPGSFTMTNKRFIMTGEKGFDYPIDRLTAIQTYSDGVSLQFGKTSYTVLMDEPFWIPKLIDLHNKRLELHPDPPSHSSFTGIEYQHIDPDEHIPSPSDAEISYLDAKALKYWNKKKTDFAIPQYYSQTAFGRNVEPALKRLLDGGYLEIGGIEKSIALKTVPEIKAILADKELKTSGNKAELIQRLINNIDPDELNALFPVGVYCITKKGQKALEPYAALEKNDEHALGLSYYRIMQEREKDDNASDEDILVRLLSQDIQDCYQNNDKAGFQQAITKGARFMEENGEYRKALDAYILSFFMWSVEAQSYNFGNSDQQSYYIAKNLERCASMCGMSISELINQIKKVVTENHPFGLEADSNIQKCITRFKAALSIQ